MLQRFRHFAIDHHHLGFRIEMLFQQSPDMQVGIGQRVADKNNFTRGPNFKRRFAKKPADHRMTQGFHIGGRHDEGFKPCFIQRANVIVFLLFRPGITDKHPSVQVDLAVPGGQKHLVATVAVFPVQTAMQFDNFEGRRLPVPFDPDRFLGIGPELILLELRTFLIIHQWNAIIDIADFRIQRFESLFEQRVVIEGDEGHIPVVGNDMFPEPVIDRALQVGLEIDDIMDRLDEVFLDVNNGLVGIAGTEAFLLLDKIIHETEDGFKTGVITAGNLNIKIFFDKSFELFSDGRIGNLRYSPVKQHGEYLFLQRHAVRVGGSGTQYEHHIAYRCIP